MADRVREAGEALLRRADLAAERWSGLVRTASAAVLLLLLWFIQRDVPSESTDILKQIATARITLWLFLVVGLMGFLVARRDVYLPSFGYVTTAADAALISTN